ncbi:T9SS type A sorting domain-containing protein [candidate division WOR-3 bacterium]|uniref:T9SS type A sorting domain-containing protein n=1 Tax=candidate division WOR-3 bacterium TaxID=2052148 RepID=A0A9D5K9K8_UNCW3|nr:T9SS type A sorting domain-containing protein [candidate division WOR-3 bacterium]MBD3364942.1 T9SS type A sorting domain-containing protein [candidate division WOR-3 bacterium]
MKRIKVGFCVGIVIPLVAFSWINRYGDEGSNRLYAMDLIGEGGFITAGRTTNNDDYGIAYIMKCNDEGDTLWTRTFGGPYEERIYSVRETSDTGFIMAGFTYSFTPSDGCNVYILKTDGNGDTLWTRSYGGIDRDSATCIYEVSSGGYIVSGSTRSFGAGKGDIWILRLDASGDTIWTKTIGDSLDDEGCWITETQDNGFIVAGSKGDPQTNNSNLYLVKIDGTGQTIWEKAYEVLLGGKANSIIPTSDGNYIVTGYSYSHDIWGDVYLAKITQSGNLIWSNTYGGISKDRGFSVAETTEAGYVITGYTLSYGKGNADIYLVKTDANGDSLWARTYGDVELDEAYEIYETEDGSYVFAGRTRSWGSVRCDFFIVKTDKDGNPAITEEDERRGITIKSYPNPFSVKTLITYNLPCNLNVKFSVFDNLGRKVNTLHKGFQDTGFHTLTWNGQDYCGDPLPAGLYFVHFQAPGLSNISKVVLVR